MPFNVGQLRTEMSQAILMSNMLNQLQLTNLMNALNIDGAVNALAVNAIQWGLYWTDLGNRITLLGGTITTATANAGFGLVLPPVLLPNIPAHQNRGLVVLLNDCFDDTWRWMQQANFLPAQALANHIRLLRL